ncbi:MAG: hypothetical protein OHK0019_07020 [Saprospiraceae bacterium]
MFEQQVNLGPGTGTVTQHTLEILIMLLGAFLLGLWLGWMLWNKFKQEADKLRLDLQSMNATITAINGEMGSLKTKLATAEANNLSLRAQVDKLTEDNQLLQERLSQTSKELAETDQRNRQLETELGLSFASPTTTPATIPLEINVTQEKSDEVPLPITEEPPTVTAVIETPDAEVIVKNKTTPSTEKPEENISTPAAEETQVITPAAETTAVPTVILTTAADDEKDDLTVVEGIGPKIQELLYQYGICSYRQLAETDVARLKEILSEAGPQLAMHDPGTWPSQANLAANDQWEALKSIQGFLKGGKKPT